MDNHLTITDKNAGHNEINFHEDLNKSRQLSVLCAKNALITYGPNSVALTCSFCHQYTITTVKFSPSYRTHLSAALLCAIGCICCVWLPYSKDECKTKMHYCSHCNTLLGTCLSR